MILLGLQYSVFHGSNSLNHHSSLQRQTENCSREVHGHIQTLSDEEAYVNSSAHILALNIEDAKKARFLQIINNKIKIGEGKTLFWKPRRPKQWRDGPQPP